jgi:hypothetical protein
MVERVKALGAERRRPVEDEELLKFYEEIVK